MKKNLEVEIYFSPDGKPTCARNFSNGEVCIFLLQRNFGQKVSCFFQDGGFNRGELEYENGFSVPCSKCPLHEKI